MIDLCLYVEKHLPKQKCQFALPCGITNVYQFIAKTMRAKGGESQSRGAISFQLFSAGQERNWSFSTEESLDLQTE